MRIIVLSFLVLFVSCGISKNTAIPSEINNLKNLLLVPKKSILVRDGRELVFVVRDSIANWCYVTSGERNDKYVEIKESEFNLQPNEPVIVEGHFSLAHGAKVSSIEKDKF